MRGGEIETEDFVNNEILTARREDVRADFLGGWANKDERREEMATLSAQEKTSVGLLVSQLLYCRIDRHRLYADNGSDGVAAEFLV
jgi:hypothetical protein